ncbi:hypothetical protein [Alkalihalophilus marmarensis]|uniref:hypothetical protein n=1 Tax=Alkalihalophilus marmarensis TaxID=521377 RepID=UPI002E21DD6A|nr:hypothetical protein [Alkalihalophilus marmarensis]
MSKNKWVRSISFNKKNEKDVERLKLIGKKSFSRFIKKLLDEEIIRTSDITRQRIVEEVTIKVGTPQETKEIKPVQVRQSLTPNPPPKTFNPMLKGRE